MSLLRIGGDLGKTMEKYKNVIGIKTPEAKHQWPKRVTNRIFCRVLTKKLDTLQATRLYTNKDVVRLTVLRGPFHKTYVPMSIFIKAATIRLKLFKVIFAPH